MQPAGFVARMWITAERSHGRTVVALERSRQQPADLWIARPTEIDERGAEGKVRRKNVFACAVQECHSPRTVRCSQRKKHLSTRTEGVEPGLQGMSCASAGDEYVGRLKCTHGAVAMNQRYLRPGLKCDARSFRERFVNLDCRYFSVSADEFRENGGVISGTASQVEYFLVNAYAQLIEIVSPKAGLTVVDSPCCVECDEHVVIDMPRIRIPGCGELSPPQNPPGTRPYEAFSRHRRESGEKLWRVHVR